jgi:hypothetical protein
MHSRKGHGMGASGGPTMPLHVIILKLAVSEKKQIPPSRTEFWIEVEDPQLKD